MEQVICSLKAVLSVGNFHRHLTPGDYSDDLNSCFATVCHGQPVSHLPLGEMGSLMPLNIVQSEIPIL